MKTKKIKIFLAGYINATNAQNLNCRSLAEYLDPEKFEIWTMLHPGGILPKIEGRKNIHYIRCRRPVRFGQYLAYLKGIMRCNVAYLPKCELTEYCARLLRLCKTKGFMTIEGVIANSNYIKMRNAFGSDEGIRRVYSSFDRTFSITRYMSHVNQERFGIRSYGMLYLGVNTRLFTPQPRNYSPGRPLQAAFIGNNMRYKGVDEIYKLAEMFPQMQFHIAGGGIGYDAQREIDKRKLTNVHYLGTLSHTQLVAFLQQMDLHIFPSRSEGFPKVTLETAAMGVPSIVYADYGAKEWITSGKDGYVVETFDEIVAIVKMLREHPEKLETLSAGAIRMAARFDWRTVIKEWEDQIVDLCSQK